ncbi:MAG: hypothetical protein F7C08_04045 [Desulfurococcales archaeon]|nr:hypothetical protein [Desulfurococcales archaeon]MCE4605685.1 hypothetical protein [Desulfurococcales archaeon]
MNELLDPVIQYVVSLTCSAREPRKPEAPRYLIEAANNVATQLGRPRPREPVCPICGARLKSGLGLCRHLSNTHYDDILAMIRYEVERVSSSYSDP